MSLRNRILLPVLISIFLAGCSTFIGVSISIKHMTNRQVAKETTTLRRVVADVVKTKINQYEGFLEATQTQVLEQASLFSCLPQVRDAYRVAMNGNTEDENDSNCQTAREMLRKSMIPFTEGFRGQTGGRELRLHFHLASGHSLLRSWRKGWQTVRDGKKIDISDDLTGFRNTVIKVNRDHKPVVGIEAGRGGFVVRGVVPITDSNGNHLGSVEVFSGLIPVLDQLKSNGREEYAVYMDKKLLDITTKLQDPSKNPILDDQFVFVAATNPKLTQEFATSEFLAKGQQGRTFQTIGDTQLAAWPVNDFSGNAVGVILMARDISAENAAIASVRRDGRQAMRAAMFGVGLATFLAILSIGSLMFFIVRRINSTLEKLIQNLSYGASRISKASHQVAGSSTQLAESSSTAAANLEETSAALAEMSAMTMKNSETAEKANLLAEDANRQTTEGTVAMERLSESIGRIKSSSDQTANILKTIDEIAFQTNLLALNAAVEAARAGDAGKGFAVVAEEVRNLASRSAQAARSTASLIDEAQSNANDGVEVNKEVAEILARINQSVTGAADLMAEVNTSSREQSRGITEITKAVDSMDSVTQGNAASSEEIASSGEELSAQACELNQMVNVLVELVTGNGNHADSRRIDFHAGAEDRVIGPAGSTRSDFRNQGPGPAARPSRPVDEVIPFTEEDEELLV